MTTMAQKTFEMIENASWDEDNNYNYGYSVAVEIARENGGFEVYNANESLYAGRYVSFEPSRAFFFIEDGSRLMVTSSTAYVE